MSSRQSSSVSRRVVARELCHARSDAADADEFIGRFGGEKFDPRQSGKGRNWMQWKK
jgi:hypothetical protein